MTELANWIEEHQLKQANAAQILLVSRPRVSDLETCNFTIDTLVEMLSRIGKPIKLAVVQQDRPFFSELVRVTVGLRIACSS